MLRSFALTFVVCLSPLFSSVVNAFPETIRYNYKSCGACHVSPSGGGVLTDYGKLTGGEMATWGYEGEGRTDYGALENFFNELPDGTPTLNVGGDLRYVWGGYKTAQELNFFRFPMQSDMELALHLTRELSLVAGVGLYGRERVKEYRKHYLLYKATKNLSFRFGRFIPAYGILVPDHTTATRQGLGFGQGTERYSAEVSYVAKTWELFLTGSMGGEVNIEGSQRQALHVTTEQERATIVRAAYYLGDSGLMGVSYYYGRYQDNLNRFGGLFYSWALTPTLYTNGDVSYRPTKDDGLWYYRVLEGWEFFKGAHVRYISEWEAVVKKHALELAWFPRPHWEMWANYQITKERQRWLVGVHYYL